MAPAGTPAAIVQTVNAVTNQYLQSAAGRDLIARQSAEAGGGTPEDAAAFVRREIEKWKPVIEAARISLN
jgi:tripartite-type tricarboxylate transporter receptor subunit TctC